MCNFEVNTVMYKMELLHVYEQKPYLPEKIEVIEPTESISKLECKTYGFDCSFIATGDIEKVIQEFRKHTLEEHFIDYPEGVVMKLISRKHI